MTDHKCATRVVESRVDIRACASQRDESGGRESVHVRYVCASPPLLSQFFLFWGGFLFSFPEQDFLKRATTLYAQTRSRVRASRLRRLTLRPRRLRPTPSASLRSTHALASREPPTSPCPAGCAALQQYSSIPRRPARPPPSPFLPHYSATSSSSLVLPLAALCSSARFWESRQSPSVSALASRRCSATHVRRRN